MSEYITTVALINGEPATVAFTREFLESLFPEAALQKTDKLTDSITVEQLAEQFKKRSLN